MDPRLICLRLCSIFTDQSSLSTRSFCSPSQQCRQSRSCGLVLIQSTDIRASDGVQGASNKEPRVCSKGHHFCSKGFFFSLGSICVPRASMLFFFFEITNSYI